MKRRRLKRWLPLLLAFSMLATSVILPASPRPAYAEGEAGAYAQMELFVTEILPDNTGTDLYEYFEIYNNSNKALAVGSEDAANADYQLLYRYTSGSSADFKYTLPTVTIEPGELHVFWYNPNSGKTLVDFNDHYKTSIADNQLTQVAGFPGFANGGSRAVVIKNKKTNAEIAQASYLGTDVGAGLSVQFTVPASGKEQDKFGLKATPTPGSYEAAQIPPEQVVLPDVTNEPPVIVHTPLATVSNDNDAWIQAEITDANNDTVTASVYYKPRSQAGYAQAPLTKGTGNAYEGAIPKAALTEPVMEYYIEASDGTLTKSTPVNSFNITLTNVNFDGMPPFLITELVPDSTNVGTADGYEFVEIYNNTDRDLNFDDYKLVYRYPASGPDADVIWPGIKEDIIIPSKETLVFWVINGQNGDLTVDDFNAFYQTSLVGNVDIVKVNTGGMANGDPRGLIVKTNAGEELAVAIYNENGDDTVADKSILYSYPTNGTANLIKLSAGTEAPTPGSVKPLQVPEITVTVPDDTVPPQLANLTSKSEAIPSSNVELKFDAEDDVSVKSVALFYKNNLQSGYTKRYLQQSFADSMYHHMIYSPEMIGKEYIDYYLEVSDGFNKTTTDTYRLTVIGGLPQDGLRLNAADGDVLTGQTVIKGTANAAEADAIGLSINDEAISQEMTYHAIESDAYFAFEVKSVNLYFKNAVTIGAEILRTFDDTINAYETLTIPIDSKRLTAGPSNTVSIRAGSKSSPFDDRPEENKDDFEIRNVRLVLADGTEYYDLRYANPNTEIKMGDSAGKNPFIDFTFNIPADKFTSKAYSWDTTTVDDGSYTVKAAIGGDAVTAQVKVDNTAPAITATVEDGQTYKGSFVINAEATDEIAGVGNVAAKLDGEEVALPHTVSSVSLNAGEHTLTIEASDKVDNKTMKTIKFTTPVEAPDKPVFVSQGIIGPMQDAVADLIVKVTDPTDDAMKVSFYRGYLYDAMKRGSFTGFRNAADTEPPREQAPAGETAMTDGDYARIAKADSDYLTDDSDEQFPYHRFEVKLDESVKATDLADIEWKGKSLEGRKVTLYVWNHTLAKWDAQDVKIAGAGDFTLSGRIEVGDYAKDHTVNVLVQDEVPSSPESVDYSFVWMSDTQYYSESYPHIYESIVNWIADNKEAYKIKYVFHTGDLVDEADKPEQWVVASKNMKVLENANIPYGVLAGNHDVDHKLGAYDQYWANFGADRYKDEPTYGGSYDNNRGHYDLISSNGNDYIMMYMGWGLGDEEIKWMDEVLKKFPERKAILNFHEYLLVSGNRSPIAEKIYEKVVLTNPNVIAVLSGHYHDAELLTDAIDDDGDGTPDRNVYQMLADYQGGPNGGDGYIRLMQFDVDSNKLHIVTYSPSKNNGEGDLHFYDPEEYPGKDEFTLDLDLAPKAKRVATDYLGVKVYTDHLIGSGENVQSDTLVAVRWSDFSANAVNEWFAVAEDAFGGKTYSDVWTLTNNPNNPQQPVAAGTPYTADGKYDVTVPHIIINQVYGGGLKTAADTYASNGFVELYNPTNSDIDLSGWSLQYADRGSNATTGPTQPWSKLDLTGTIKARSSYLIAGAATGASPDNLKIDLSAKADQNWNRFINNKGLKVALMSNQTLLTDANPFVAKPAGYVDLLGTGSNDSGSDIDGFETAYPSGSAEGTSKKKAIRRVDLTDTDNNKANFEQIDYSEASTDTVALYGPRSGSDGEWGVVRQPLAFETTSLPNAAAGMPYAAAITVSGGTPPYTFAASGLPEGLSLNASTGVIAGTPANPSQGTYNVTLTVTDGASAAGQVTLALTVNEAIKDRLSVTKIGSYRAGSPNSDGGVAEIVKYNKDNGKFYLVNGGGNPPTLDIVVLGNAAGPVKEKSVLIKELVEKGGFVYGDLTSVDVNTATKRVFVAVQEADPLKTGKILMLDYAGNLLKSYDAGVQPDMIKVTADGRYVLTADEAEPRTEAGDPEGSVTIVDTETDSVVQLKFDDPSIIGDGVHIRGASDPDSGLITGKGAKADAIFDLEPEYIALSDDQTKAYVSLQENNAVAAVDLTTKKIVSVKGFGFKDYSLPANSLDLVKDGEINLENVPFYGMYMPDGVAAYTMNGKTYLFSANEGDVTEWPGRENGSKVADMKKKLDPASAAALFLQGKSQYDKLEVASDMGTDGIYAYGARSFSVWDTEDMKLIYDSGNSFEQITAQRLPGNFNAGNNKTALDDRSAKKGPEPEDIKIGKVGDKIFAFIGLERIGGIMIYDVTDPTKPVFVNYTNTREFTPDNNLETDTAPEGIEFIPAADSPTGKPLLLVANEVGGTVAVLQLNVQDTSSPNPGTPGQTPGPELEPKTEKGPNGRPLAVTEINAGTFNALVNKLAAGDNKIKLSADLAPNGGLKAKLPLSALNDAAAKRPDAVIVVTGGKVSFSVPVSVLADGAAGQLDGEVTVSIIIEPASDEVRAAVQQAASSEGAAVHGDVYDFIVFAEAGEESVELHSFGGVFAERTIWLGQSIDTENATAVRYDTTAGKLMFVPSTFAAAADGQTQVTMKRNGNSYYTVVSVRKSFEDVKPDHWAKQSVESLASKLIVNGVSERQFKPSQSVTRAEFTALVVRALGLNLGNGSSSSFSDVGGSSWYAAFIEAAVRSELISGYEDGTFKPDRTITRQEMAVILSKAMAFAGSAAAGDASSLSGFADQGSIAAWAQQAAADVAAAGIIKGNPDGTFAPAKKTTRAEAVVMLESLLKHLKFIN
ncbi:choice-of-anchor I family protein [Paenibacillus harenae]|uniref:choice-of-anchor I family protein n=1 Tax=Paenibacillus harenae TaxID=306543 RepID=UPI00146B6B90|nr:choice-of-anchor I family protein [Paenibacillus harenae]